jgi:hypothetical protein
MFLAVVVAAICVVAVGAGAASARSTDSSIYVVTSPGTNAPPATLGPFFMAAYPTDNTTTPCASTTTHVPSPSGASALYFSYAVEHARVPACWSTWSNGYTGDVYYNEDNGDLGLKMPGGTRAFYLYVEPDAFAVENVTVTAYGTTGFSNSATVAVNGSGGAQYFGFYSPQGTIASITVSDPSDDFAVGEFGLAYNKIVKAG